MGRIVLLVKTQHFHCIFELSDQLGVAGSRKGKVVVGSLLVARKHTKAAGAEEISGPCGEGGLQRGALHGGRGLAAAPSTVSR